MSILEMTQAAMMALGAVFLMEIGDKTQLTAFALSIRYQSPFRVFFGVITGLTGVTLIAVLLGIILKETIDFQLLKPFIAILFVIGGVFIIYSEFKNNNDIENRICPVSLDQCTKPKENCPEIDNCELFKDATIRKGAFIRSAILMFGAELGDKTMLMGLGLATQFDPIGVFIGALIALTMVNAIGVFAGDKVANKIPRKTLGLISGILFIITGILIFLRRLTYYERM
jgi:putative Ca2+/H+ antiporter (TMEM165/GDT1 family)